MYLLRENCWLEHSGVSFRIPENYYFDPEEPYYFCCMPRKKGFKVYYELCWEDIDVEQSLKEYQEDTYETSAPIERIEHNGLKGYCSTFGDVEEEIFIAKFPIVDREKEFNRFQFSIRTKKFNIKEIKALPEFKKLFDYIWKPDRKRYKVKID